MAQYFEVLSQNEGNLNQQTHQFFNGNQENERTRVRYILADDTAQFQTQQLIVAADQVMVLENSQQQLQRIVIDQGHSYQTSNQQQQFGAIVRNSNMNNQPTQQIFYMETNSGQVGENRQAVQTVIEQAGNQNSPTTPQSQQIVLNHQMGSSSPNITNRQVVQESPGQRPVLQIRTPMRQQTHIQVNQQARPLASSMRQGLPQQVRPHQPTPIPMRNMPPQHVQMRVRTTVPQIRQPVPQIQQPQLRQVLQQQSPRLPALTQLQQAKNPLTAAARQMAALQQQKQQLQSQQQVQQSPPPPLQQSSQQQVVQQQHQQQPVVQQQHQPQQVVQQQQAGVHMVANQIQKASAEFQSRQPIKNNQEKKRTSVQCQAKSLGKHIVKPLTAFRPFSVKKNDVDELDDHDPSMNSTPGQMANYKKLLEQRHIGKNPILARLPSNIKITTSSAGHQQQLVSTSAQQCLINQTIDQVVSQHQPVGVPQHLPVGVPQQQSVGVSQQQSVGVSQQQSVGVSQQQSVGISQQQSVGISQQQSVGISQQQSVGISQQQSVSISQQQPVGVPQQPQANQILNANAAIPNTAQVPQKKPRAPPRTKNPAGTPRAPGGANRVRMQKLPVAQQPFNGPRVAGSQQNQQVPRFSLNQPPPRFNNQQQMMQQQRAQLHQQQQQQNAQPQQSVPLPSQIASSPQRTPPSPIPQSALPPIQHNGLSSTTGGNSPVQMNNTPSQINNQSQMNNSQSHNMNNSQSQQITSASNQSQMNYLITPPTPNRPRQQRPLPSYIPSSQIQQIIENTPIAEEFSDSIRMLVLLENGEQRLITFTLPKEACTIMEILEQVSVPFTPETNIQVTEANTNGINYIVTVGNVSNFGYGNNEEEQQPESSDQEPMAGLQSNQPLQPNGGRVPFGQKTPLGQLSPPMQPSQSDPPKPTTPELPKLIPGKLAVCVACGYTGEDFNKCRRCNRKLPDNVKSVEAPMKTIDFLKGLSSETTKQLPTSTSTGSYLVSMPPKPNSNSSTSTNSPISTPSKPEPGPKPPSPKKKVKAKHVENESVVISSDEEEDDKKPVQSVSEQLLNKLGASISISPVTKEPSLTEIKKHVRKVYAEPTKFTKLPLKCRTVRIGSYRFAPSDYVILDSKCVIIKAPMADNKNEIRTVRIDRGDIVKVLICYNKGLPVIFYYLNVGAAPIIREMLNLSRESGLYFDPIDETEDSYRKITLLPDDLIEEHKSVFQQLYGIAPYNIIDELTAKEGNDILIKTCPKDSSSSMG